MTAAASLSRRGLAGFLGFVAAVPAATAAEGPDARLEAALAALNEAEQQLGALPDDDPRESGLMAQMDLILVRAAMTRPTTDRGFAVKARIARVYRDSRPGELVESMLLSDLMIRGREPVREPTEQDVLDAYRAMEPDSRAAFDRFVRRSLDGYPFDESLAQLAREVPVLRPADASAGRCPRPVPEAPSRR